MKGIINSFCLIFIGTVSSFGQELISYQTHALQSGYIHKTQKIENVNEGMSGNECLWDFSSLICGDVSQSAISESIESEYHHLFENSNLVIGVTGDQSFFTLNENQLEYLGYISQNVVIQFDNPIVRMKYPFHFLDKIEGTVTGTGLHNGVVQTILSGNYSIEADGMGNLLLPNDVSISNAFRVKSVENFTETACNTVNWTITKYLWYATDYRYPVFTIIHKEVVEGNDTTRTHNAYYNDDAITLSSDLNKKISSTMRLNVFPNPTTDKITIKYFVPELQDVSVELFSISGKKIRDIIPTQKQKGEYVSELSALESDMVPGVYLIKFLFGSNAIVRKIMVEY